MKIKYLFIILLFFVSISVTAAENVDNNTLNFWESLKSNFNLDQLPFFQQKENHYGYWLWASDMYKANLTELSKDGVTDIFLNSYAFKEYGESKVLNWIQTANDNNINVHIWIQTFYEDEWTSPVNNGTFNTNLFNEKINDAKYYADLDGISGIQFDYLRFDGTASQYNNSTQAINYFIKNATKEIKEVNPNIKISATVMPEPELMEEFYGQDFHTISKYVDIVVPMEYKGNYEQNTSWINNTTEWYVNNTNGADIWVGVQSYRSDNNISQLSLNELKSDMAAGYDGGADKVVIFKWGMNSNID